MFERLKSIFQDGSSRFFSSILVIVACIILIIWQKEPNNLSFFLFTVFFPFFYFLFSSTMYFLSLGRQKFRLIRVLLGYVFSNLIYAFLLSFVLFILSIDVLHSSRGRILKVEEYNSAFSNFYEYGLQFPEGAEVEHAATFSIADDNGVHFVFRINEADLTSVLNEKIVLQPYQANEDFNFPNYFLCTEDSGAKLTVPELLNEICNERSEGRKILFFNARNIESQRTYEVVYFEDASLLWLSYLRW